MREMGAGCRVGLFQQLREREREGTGRGTLAAMLHFWGREKGDTGPEAVFHSPWCRCFEP